MHDEGQTSSVNEIIRSKTRILNNLIIEANHSLIPYPQDGVCLLVYIKNILNISFRRC